MPNVIIKGTTASVVFPFYLEDAKDQATIMKRLLQLIYVLCALVLVIEASFENKLNTGHDRDENINDVRTPFEVLTSSKYKCPSPFGKHEDPEDCSRYYVCVADIPVHRRCKNLYNFDIIWRKCLPFIVAVCGKDWKNKETTTTIATTIHPTASTSEDDSFTCPSIWGVFPHPEDCAKYYTCLLFKEKLKSCTDGKLFDAVKNNCNDANKVNCGNRQRPGSSTTVITEIYTETDEPSTTMEISTETTATDTSTVAPEITTEIIPTESRPTGPPETTCEPDDVDCIIDDTGDVGGWFKCPESMGGYPYPTSDKLFIFCMNWVPSLKKCGLDLVFSKELSTCVEIE